MSYSYDLISQPWIPCKTIDGQHVELGLQDVLLRAHELQAIEAETPLVTASLYRLLLAVLHRLFGPKDIKAWGKLWVAKKWHSKTISQYFTQHKNRFNLFHEKYPFYQGEDARVRLKSVINLVPHFASGNNATLFDHRLESETLFLPPAEAARFTVALQSFGLAGLSGLSGENFKDGPLSRGVNFLIVGLTLFETLCLNMLRYDIDEDLPFPSTNSKYLDKPAWESEDPYQPPRNKPLGYLDYLTWQSRKVLLLAEMDKDGNLGVSKIKIAPGLSISQEDTRDPMQHYRADEKKGWLIYRFREGRALWRDSSALFSIKKLAEGVKVRPPLTFEWVARLVYEGLLDASQTLQIRALGMASNQAKIDFYKQETMPLPLKFLQSDQLVNMLGDEIEKAEEARTKLWGVLRKMAELFLSVQVDLPNGRKPDPEDIKKLMAHWNAESLYWAGLEVPFYDLLRDLPSDPVGSVSRWRKIVRFSARRAFEGAQRLIGLGFRALKASAQARSQLDRGLAHIFESPEQEEVA